MHSHFFTSFIIPTGTGNSGIDFAGIPGGLRKNLRIIFCFNTYLLYKKYVKYVLENSSVVVGLQSLSVSRNDQLSWPGLRSSESNSLSPHTMIDGLFY